MQLYILGMILHCTTSTDITNLSALMLYVNKNGMDDRNNFLFLYVAYPKKNFLSLRTINLYVYMEIYYYKSNLIPCAKGKSVV